jgi:hypothetical protein
MPADGTPAGAGSVVGACDHRLRFEGRAQTARGVIGIVVVGLLLRFAVRLW